MIAFTSNPFNLCKVGGEVPTFILDFGSLFFFFSFIILILLFCSKNQLCGSFRSFPVVPASSLVSTLIFIISLFLLALGLICCSFSRCLSLDYWFKVFLLSKTQAFKAINLPVSTALAAFHNLYVVFSFSFSSKYFLISSLFHFWNKDYLKYIV